MISRAHQTALFVRMMPRGRRTRLPRQIYPKAIEREYTKRLVAIVDRMRGAFAALRAELPSLLHAVHSERRLDAGEGSRIRALINQAKARMRSSILTPELDNLAATFAQRTADHQREQFARQTRAALGVNINANDRNLAALQSAFVDANVGYITKLTDDVAGRVETSVLSAVQKATPWDEYAKELDQQFDFGENRAELIARDQIGKFYGQTNATRQRELGITSFVWRTANDERVRPEHEDLDGHVFSYDDPPSEGLPGEPIQCRCTAEPDFSSIQGLASDAPASDDKPDLTREENPALRGALGWNYEAPHAQVGVVSGRMLQTPGRKRVEIVQSNISVHPITPAKAEMFLDRIADKPLDVAEQHAINRYQGGAFVDFNAYARTGDFDSGSSFASKADAERQIAALESAIRKGSVPDDVLLYRGVKAGSREGVTGKLEAGNVIRDRGFSSTSISRNTADEFGSITYEIEVPKGTHAAFIPPDGSLRESELLLGRNSAFKVLRVREENGRKIARVRLQKTR